MATFLNPVDANVRVDACRNLLGITLKNASDLTFGDGTLVLTASATIAPPSLRSVVVV